MPNVIFASPGRTQPWPTRLPCWSPTSAAERRRPGERGRLAEHAGRVDDRRAASPSARPARRRPRPTTRCASASSSPVTAALDGSVTCTAPPDSTHATHVSTVPKHRSRSRAPAMLFSSQATFVADWFGASARPCSALAVMQSNTVRRSCQPSPGPIGSPVAAIPHQRRGPLVGDARRPRPGRRRPATSVGDVEHRGGHRRAVELDEPGKRCRRRERSVLECVHGSVAVDDRGAQPGRADVDDEHAHDEPLLDARLDDG